MVDKVMFLCILYYCALPPAVTNFPKANVRV